MMTKLKAAPSRFVKDFGCDRYIRSLTVALEGLAQDALAFALGINIGTIKQINSGINGRVNHLNGFIGWRRPTEIHGTQYDR